eukprot:TRINITY_DN6346_c0_g1_i4.p1 TRINITY_DN6346_c0_g1~~TRINITY_DN6346_c0_g1_i4.p1  ORF type:complete len:174 (+),score=44.49 TRINITY_DN6346_c0_g1_i4:68-523(+)
MRVVIQRVLNANVNVGGKEISRIDRGLLVLVGISETDTTVDRDYIAKKLLNLRLWQNADGRPWDQSVTQKDYEILLVSQFTLYGRINGNKPDFSKSAKSPFAKPFYEDFIQHMRKSYKEEKIKDGEFGAMMEVGLVNDGPVTLQFLSLIHI